MDYEVNLLLGGYNTHRPKNKHKQMWALELKSLRRGERISRKRKMDRIHLINGFTYRQLNVMLRDS
jgi:hypothetical protein